MTQLSKISKEKNVNKLNIDNINNFVDEDTLFDSKKLLLEGAMGYR